MFLVAWLLGSSAFAALGDVVSSFPAPGSQAGGLAWDGVALWYADYGASASTIYRLSTVGSIYAQWSKNIPYMMGLAWDGNYLWADSLTQRYVYKLNPVNCSVLSSFYGPSAHMMGMGCGGEYLYINDWQDRRVAKVTFDGMLVQLINVQPPNPSGVAIQGNYLWYTTRDFFTPSNALCVKALLSNGSTVASFQCPDSQATDLAFDGVYLWVSGYTNKQIYQVDLGLGNAVTPASLGKVKVLFR